LLLFVCFLDVTTHCGCIFHSHVEGFSLLIQEVSWSHTTTRQSVVLLWASYQSVAEISTWQHTTITTDKHPCPSGIRTHNLSGRAAVDLRLRPRGSKGYYLTLIQERYPVCDYNFINSVLPSIPTKTLEIRRRPEILNEGSQGLCESRQTYSRITFQIRLRLSPLPHASQYILGLDAIQFKLRTATLNKLHIKLSPTVRKNLTKLLSVTR
jgi:hypothetical protein